MFNVQFNTKDNQAFTTSRYSQEKLRIPLSINVNELNQDEIKSIVAKFHEMGAERLFQRGEAMTLEDYTSESMENINELLVEYKAEKAAYFKFPEKIHLSMFFNQHGVLRIVAGKGYLKGGCTVYDRAAFMEYSDALDCDLPLTLEKAVSATKTPEH